ncbi:hypothetical protein ACET3X_004896 [Alternaria dauci]|uniref:carbonic anhydrase n=1 Tax=Alternaria dauci TaxID=48095 RepID=A0ABR3ULE9_9PLEO
MTLNVASDTKDFSTSQHTKQIPGSAVPIAGGIDFTDVTNVLGRSAIQTYTGSLTTPPCAEGVTFIIVKEPLPVNVSDFNAIKKIIKFNSRFIQNTLGGENILAIGGASGNSSAAAAAAPAARSNPEVAADLSVGLGAAVQRRTRKY